MITAIVFVVLLFVGAPIGVVLAVSAAAYLIDAGNTALIGSYALQQIRVAGYPSVYARWRNDEWGRHHH
jgi:ABC-type transporter Mla maintaining outer membrane lipid asymmetry permease subunit MlaE